MRLEPLKRGLSSSIERLGGKAVVAFLAIGLVFGTAVCTLTPPFWGNDGMSQFARAFQVAHGRFAPVEIDWGENGRSWGGDIPVAVWHLYEHAGADLGKNPDEPAPFIDSPEEYSRLGSAVFSPEQLTTVWFTNTAAYSPVSYVPSAVMVRVSEALALTVVQAMWLMAMAAMVSYVFAVAFSIWILRGSRLQWVFFALALFPAALFQASSISADSLTTGLAFVFMALVARSIFLHQELGRFEVFALLASVVLLPLGKPTYIVLVALLLFVPKSDVWTVASWRLAKTLTLLSTLGLWLWWTTISAATSKYLAFYRADYQDNEFGLRPQLEWILSHPTGFLRQLWNTFVYRDNFYFLNPIGASNVRIASLSTALAWVAVFIAIGVAPVLSSRSTHRRAVWGVLGLSVVAIFATLYVSFTPVGFHLVDGVQGRYFFPLFPLGALALLSSTSWRLGMPCAPGVDGQSDVAMQPISESRAGSLITGIVFVALLLTVLKYATTVHGM